MGWLTPLDSRGRVPVQEAGPVWTGAGKSLLPPGFDPRTVQPIASRCQRYERNLKFFQQHALMISNKNYIEIRSVV
jgi:hypothetical protein